MEAKKLVASLVDYRNARSETRRSRTEFRLDRDIQQFIHDMLYPSAKGYQAIYGTFFEPTEKLSDAFMKMKAALLATENGKHRYAAEPGIMYDLAKNIVSCQLKDYRKSFHHRHECRKLVVSQEECEEPIYELVGRNDDGYGYTELTADFEKVIPKYANKEIAALSVVLNDSEHIKAAELVKRALTPDQAETANDFIDFPTNNFRVAKGRAHARATRVLAY
jgi:hypothetical protein